MDTSFSDPAAVAGGSGLEFKHLLLAVLAALIAAVATDALKRWLDARRRRDLRWSMVAWVGYRVNMALLQGPQPGVISAAQEIVAEVKRQYGPVLALCASVNGALKPLTAILEDKPAPKTLPTDKTKTVELTPAKVAIAAECCEPARAGDGYLVTEPKDPTAAEALQERSVRVFMAVQVFAAFWRETGARMGEIENAQTHLALRRPPKAPPPLPITRG